MSKITIEELKEAYIKLKSHIYHDTTELFQRRKLAEFETTTTTRNKFNRLKNQTVDEKLEKIVNLINSYNKKDKDNSFKEILEKINLIYLPKKFQKKNNNENFLSNKRIEDKYDIEKITVFADIPIELHLVVILWITTYGYKLDSKLDRGSVGNRLILNKAKDGVVKGSGLFKPYFSQYQKWRDNSVEEAQRKLQNGNKIAFINLDIKDYFYSVRLNFNEIEKIIFGNEGYKDNSIIHDIFKQFHFLFTEKLKEKQYPNNSINNIPPDTVILPIGIASSYILANYYLNDFDIRIRSLIPQVYYSRYVDDIIMVIENPNFDFHKTEKSEEIRFNFNTYIIKENKEIISYAKNEEEFYDDNIVPMTERFILETLYPLVKLVDYPEELKTQINSKKSTINLDNEKRIFKLTSIDGVYFQGEKTLLYYFDNNESIAVIDKLKQELEERSSEFRDFPEGSSLGDGSFDEQAYHLVFDGTEGKIRTLKDYKENRYGLSVFLANRIFAALRMSKNVDSNETEKLLKLFKGLNNLEHFRLWEKVFTFLIVNNSQEGFIEFYKHSVNQIIKLKGNSNIIKQNTSTNYVQNSKITGLEVISSLVNYFNIAFELSLSLYPDFIKEDSQAYKKLNIIQEQLENSDSLKILAFIDDLTLTKIDSDNIIKFRSSNLIRHHYVTHPLLNYTKAFNKKDSRLSLVDYHLPQSQITGLQISDATKKLSPRQVKFWECCISETTNNLLDKGDEFIEDKDGRYHYTSIFNGSDENNILKQSFELYTEINTIHFPNQMSFDDFCSHNYIPINSLTGEKEIGINEIHIGKDSLFKENPSISIANIKVNLPDIESSIKGKPNLSNKRYSTFTKLLKESRKADADIIIFPEFSVPYEFVPSLAKYSEKNQIAIVAGLEHWNVDNICYNFIVTIIPVKVNGVNDAIVLYRLKNHYAHAEEMIIRGFGYSVPKPIPYRYDLINWRNLYFTSFYCFELADTFHRSLFRSKIDLLIASEWNKDTPYFSNIVEALSRDLHCYIAQVNTSQYGDSRLTQPTDSARKDLMKLKGGKNDTVLVEELNIKKLREFQLKYFERIKLDNDETFKPVPPDWNRTDVNNRIENKRVVSKRNN